MRAAAIWRFREALDPEHGDDLAIPRNRKLRREALAHRWSLSTMGIQIDSKKEVKDKIGRSPNIFDAYVLANWTESLIGDWSDFDDLGSVEDHDSKWR